MHKENLIEKRRDYTRGELRRSQLMECPYEQFRTWLSHARAEKLIDATAMVLATVDNTGKPHSRVVLLKNFDTDGLCFYTNYDSNKGVQLAQNPYAALLFYWRELERQVRIEGKVDKLSAQLADEYFHSRPEGSRFSAAASRQSKPVADRSELETSVKELKARFPEGNVDRPDNWGGYRLKAHFFEFWQGRADRLHDRFCYQQDAQANTWNIQRLSP